jgi:hypothetical protein
MREKPLFEIECSRAMLILRREEIDDDLRPLAIDRSGPLAMGKRKLGVAARPHSVRDGAPNRHERFVRPLSPRISTRS